MITVDSVSFDVSNCELKQQEQGLKGWLSSDLVAYQTRLYAAPSERPFRWPFDLTDVDTASEFYRQQCEDNKGAMLSMSVISNEGVEILQGLFKYRAPIQESMAMCFVGILYIPFQSCCFQINIESMEVGMTGIREATVGALEPSTLPLPSAESEAIVVESIEDMFSQIRASPVRQIPADDERWDEQFPDHPLLKVRAGLRRTIDSLEFSPEVKALKLFRIKDVHKKWQFWKR